MILFNRYLLDFWVYLMEQLAYSRMFGKAGIHEWDERVQCTSILFLILHDRAISEPWGIST